jgi:hypothetical protein
MSRESKEIPDSADHIKPGSWWGNVKLKDVSLQTSWNRGRHIIEQEFEGFKHLLHELEKSEGIDIFSPFGTLLFDVPLADDDVDESLEAPNSTGTSANEITDSEAHEIDIVMDFISFISIFSHGPLGPPAPVYIYLDLDMSFLSRASDYY